MSSLGSVKQSKKKSVIITLFNIVPDNLSIIYKVLIGQTTAATSVQIQQHQCYVKRLWLTTAIHCHLVYYYGYCK